MKKKVYAYLHTHWDREWYRDKEDFNLRLVEVVDKIIIELTKNKAPYFYLDGQVLALLDYLKYKPEKENIIKKLIKEKKLAIGPYYASIDSYLVSFNSMLKNLEIGLKYSNQFNEKKFIGYLADIFGISKSAFEALKLNSITKAIIWRGINPSDINNRCDFKYDNIDTTWLAQGYFNDLIHQNLPHKKIAQNVLVYLDKISAYSNDVLLFPIGGDHLNILENASNTIKSINKYLDNYEIILTSPFEYFKKAKFSVNSNTEEFLDNEKTYVLKGCYTTRIYQKIKNAKVQNKLSRIVEPLNHFFNKKYDKNIELIYESLLKNHAHDGIYGCSIDDVSKTVDYRFLKIENSLNAIEKRLIGDFKKANKIKGKSKDKVGVFNLSNSKINTVKIDLDYVLDNSQVLSKKKGFSDDLYYDTYKIPVTEDITDTYTQLVEVENAKDFSFSALKIKKPEKLVKITNKSIENGFIKLEIKNNKIEILDKKSTNSFFLTLSDIKDDGDSYNSAPIGKSKVLPLIKTKINYDGIIESSLGLYFKDIELNVKLKNKSKFLKFEAKINNKKKNHKLDLVLNLKNKIKKTISNDAIGIIERNIDPNYDIQKFMPAIHPYELKTNTYPMQSFVNSQNVVVLTKGLNEYGIYKNELKICLLRATGIISTPKNKARAIPAGPPLEIKDAQCIGEIKEEFALLFGNQKEAFNNIDEFFENYLAIDGEFRENFKINYFEKPKNSFVYGIFKNKKISYNIDNKKIELI